jgi:lipopolysaccharide biosynthesis glycosyltransferase
MKGILTYTRGENHFLQLIVLLNSLRKYYYGDIEVYLINEHPSEQKVEILRHYDVNLKLLETDWQKNTYSCIKPKMIEISNFDQVIVIDSDLLIVGNIDELLDFDTSFLAVRSDRKTFSINTIVSELNMLSNVEIFNEFFNSFDKNKEYINLGVLGVNKNTTDFLKYKELINNSINLCQYNDEIIFNLIYDLGSTTLVNNKYNVCPNVDEYINKYIDDDDNRIIHFAGSSFNDKDGIIHSKRNITSWKNEAIEILKKFPEYNFDLSRYSI